MTDMKNPVPSCPGSDGGESPRRNPHEEEQKILDSGAEIPGARPIPPVSEEPTPTELAHRLMIVLQNGFAWHDGNAEAIIDEVLTNARHLADALGVSFFDALDRSYEYYSAEVRQFGTAKGKGL